VLIERVLVADDEPLARERVITMLRRVAPTVAIREVGDGDATMELIRSWNPQALFLDIQMPGRDGFEVIDAIGADAMPPCVFVTAYDAHAIRAFDVSAVDYLLKPFDEIRFTAAWTRLERAHAAGALAEEAQRFTNLLMATGRSTRAAATPAFPERFMVKIGERTLLVPVGDIRWIQSDGNYADLYTATGKHTIRETLVGIEARLDPARFVRVHRRVIVAISFIRELQPWFGGDQILILRDGTRLRVSRTRREAVAARLAGVG
jgi:two-component system LytT family response regulator